MIADLPKTSAVRCPSCGETLQLWNWQAVATCDRIFTPYTKKDQTTSVVGHTHGIVTYYKHIRLHREGFVLSSLIEGTAAMKPRDPYPYPVCEYKNCERPRHRLWLVKSSEIPYCVHCWGRHYGGDIRPYSAVLAIVTVGVPLAVFEIIYYLVHGHFKW